MTVMSDTREILDKIFNGKMLIKRYMPRPGESPYYYLDPFYTDDYSTISDFGIIDVSDGVHPSSSVFAHQGDHGNREQKSQYPNSSSAIYAHTNNGDVRISPAQGQNREEQTNLWQDAMRNGEYMANAGIQGLSFGWSDEAEGLIHGLFYALAHYSPLSTHQDASGLDAFQRGYHRIRNQRRQNLRDGYEESPYLTGIAEVVGARASPLNLIKQPARTAPLHIKTSDEDSRTIVSGIVYGAGSSENRGGDYVKNVLSNIAGGVAGKEINRKLFGVAGAPVMREILNPVIGETVGAFVDKTIDKLFDGK